MNNSSGHFGGGAQIRIDPEQQDFLSSVLHCHLGSVTIKISEDQVERSKKTAVVNAHV